MALILTVSGIWVCENGGIMLRSLRRDGLSIGKMRRQASCLDLILCAATVFDAGSEPEGM